MGKAWAWLSFLMAVAAAIVLGHWMLSGAQPARRIATAPPVAARPVAPTTIEDCAAGSAQAAKANHAGLITLAIDAFHRPEAGWAIYAPLAAHDVGTACPADSPAFAAHLAHWQAGRGLPATGVMDAASFAAFKGFWDARRPFEAASRLGCPAAPDPATLARVPSPQAYGGKAMLMRPGALLAYERLYAAARAAVPQTRADGRLFEIFSAFRAPDEAAARCSQDGGCQGLTRALCSAHRTGLAMDIYLGAAPGHDPASSDDINRLAISQGAPYRWMVANAGRFGFVNYAYEPWHWEWTGEPPEPAATTRH
jgi:hypothetical protein